MDAISQPDRLQTAKEIASDPSLQAPAILTIGAVLWRWVSAISNVDFLLSINEEKFAVIFGFMQSTGWWILSLIGLVWLLIEWSRRTSTEKAKPFGAGIVIACSVVAFLFGVLVALVSTGAVPNIVTSWGAAPGTCLAVLDTKKLMSFRTKYKVALACGIDDPTTDKLEDTSVTFSKPFTIIGGAQTIVTPYRQAMIDHVKALTDAATSAATGSLPNQQPPTPLSIQVQVWHDPVLVPNEVSLEKVATLAELMRLGGKILRPQYYQ